MDTPPRRGTPAPGARGRSDGRITLVVYVAAFMAADRVNVKYAD